MPRGVRFVIHMLGDVVISLPTAVRQAKKAGRSIDDELAMLLVHGVLHLCGYDHERNPREEARMLRRERVLFHLISPVPRMVTFRAGREREVVDDGMVSTTERRAQQNTQCRAAILGSIPRTLLRTKNFLKIWRGRCSLLILVPASLTV